MQFFFFSGQLHTGPKLDLLDWIEFVMIQFKELLDIIL